MAIDVYIWLAYRLHALRRDVEVSWPALHAQFGAGFGQLRHFRPQFMDFAATRDGSLSGSECFGK